MNRVKKSTALKQSDYYGEWNPTNGTYVDEELLYTISSKAIEYSGVGKSGEPVEFNAPILRWEYIRNPDKSTSHIFPDGYIIRSESTIGSPIFFVLMKHSNIDAISFQIGEGGLILEGGFLLVRAKR